MTSNNSPVRCRRSCGSRSIFSSASRPRARGEGVTSCDWRIAAMPWGGLLIRACQCEHAPFAQARADDLQANGQTGTREATGNADRGDAVDVERQRVAYQIQVT